MARNSQLEPVPQASNVVGETNLISSIWLNWLLKLRYFLSTENHQLINNMSSPISLDARYVALKATTTNITITLDSPTIEGIWKTIEMTERTAPYSATLALTNVVGGTATTSANFDAAQETLVLVSKNGNWLVIKQHNVTLT